MTVLYAASGEDGKKIAPALLRQAAKLAWGWPELPAIARSPRGKPFFPDWPRRWYSISHSGGLALCALSDDGPVGADIELVRPRSPGLPDYVMTEDERSSWDGTWEDFFRVWTLKESWCKREDIPLYPPRNLVTPPPCPHKSYAGETWRAAVCSSAEPPAEIIWLTKI
jgi:phosphopantetheinyl transferase